MTDKRPEWYTRAGKGPFALPKFDDKHRRQVEQRIQAHKRKRLKPAVGLVASAAILIAGSSFLWTVTSPGDQPPQDGSRIVRAIGATEAGALQVLAGEQELQEQLGAPSCFGSEADLRLHSDYEVIYMRADGTSVSIEDLPDMTFIQPSADIVPMTRLSMGQVEVFLLVPQYKDCHGLTFHAYGIDQIANEAFPLTFRFADGTVTDNWSYSPGRPPVVQEGQLILSMSEGPGGESGEGEHEKIFELDRSARQLVETDPQ